MKKSTKLFLSLTMIGVILIGLGCGITVFELSNYKTLDYYYGVSDELPTIEMATNKLEVTLTGSEPFQLDATDWNFSGGYDVQYDNTLTDQVIIEVTAPKDLYQIALEHLGDNSYYLACELRELKVLHLSLQMAKEQYLIERLPKVHCTIYMNEAQAKQFRFNGMRDRIDSLRIYSLEETYQMQMEDTQQQYHQQLEARQQDYENRLTQQQETYDQQIQQMEEQHQEQVTQLEQQYQEQLQQKDEQIEQIQQQLEQARTSRHA